ERDDELASRSGVPIEVVVLIGPAELEALHCNGLRQFGAAALPLERDLVFFNFCLPIRPGEQTRDRHRRPRLREHHCERRNPAQDENSREQFLHVIDSSDARYGIVCGPCGSTHSVACDPAVASARSTAAPTSSIGSRCAARISTSVRPPLFTRTLALVWTWA